MTRCEPMCKAQRSFESAIWTARRELKGPASGADPAVMRQARERDASLRAPWLVGALAVGFAVWVGTGLGGDSVALYLDDLATMVAALLATVFCGRAAVKHEGRLRLFWWLFAGACGAWMLGEALWAYYDLVAGEVPVPSWADAAYLAALPVTAAALLIHPALHARRAIGRLRSLVDGLVIAVSIFFVGWTLVLEPLKDQVDLTSVGDVVTLAYPLSDVVIMFLVVLVMRGTTSTDRLDLWCLLAGLLLITFSDAIYSYLTYVEDYSSGSVIDTGWFVGYLAIALGAFYSRPQLRAERSALTDPTLTPAALMTPFLTVLAALGLVAVKLELGHPLDGVTLTIAFVLVGLVLIRQALLLIDLFVLRHQVEGSMTDRLAVALGDTVPDQRADPAATPTALR